MVCYVRHVDSTWSLVYQCLVRNGRCGSIVQLDGPDCIPWVLTGLPGWSPDPAQVYAGHREVTAHRGLTQEVL
jgi:hypothetical protein